ncbi:MAG: TraB/GumN family protein [Sphingomonadales bacterium]
MKRLINRIVFIFLALAFAGTWNIGAFAKPPLWKLQDEDTTIYLLGTFHLLRKETVWYTHEIDDALKASDVLYLELSPKELNSTEGFDYVLSRGFFPDGTYLTDFISDQEFYRLQELISEAGGTPFMVFRMKPMMASLVLSQSPLSKGYDRIYGVEEVLIGRAHKFGRPIKGMESLSVQLDALFDYSIEFQLKYLRAGINGSRESSVNINTLSEAWVNGDLEKLNIGEDEFPEYQEKLLFERNRSWVLKIKEMMREPGQIFIAVGAGHFVGQENVIELLEKEGFFPKRQ